MARKRHASKLHLLSAREVQVARDGDHSDGGGLLLRVRGDSSSWVLRFTSPTAGKRREMGLGVAWRGTLAQAGNSVTAARDLAHDARELLARGIDPIDNRDRQREADRQAEREKKVAEAREKMTLARAARDYHERVIEPSRTPKHAAQWIASLENHVPPALWNTPVDAIDAPSLLAAMQAVRSLDDPAERVPETLQRVRQRLDAVFEDGIFHGRCTTNPAAAIRRKMREAQSRRDRGQFAALPYREAADFMVKLREAPGIAARCLEFAVLTAARTSEALTADWREIDIEEGLWVIPGEKMKAGEPHTVYLSPRALDILKAQQGLDKGLVFPSSMLDGKPMSNMSLLAVLNRLGMRAQTTVHGLCRATFSSWANETGAARPDVIEACLAHREADKVRRAYNRAQFTQERRELMDAWCKYLAEPQSAKVLPFKAA